MKKFLLKNNLFKLFTTILLLTFTTICNLSCSSQVANDNSNQSSTTYESTETMTNVENQKPLSPPDSVRPDVPPDGFRPDAPPDGFNPNENGMPPMGQSKQPSSYNAMNTYNENTEEIDLDLSSTGDDESAILVDKDIEVTINNFKINRTNNNSSGGDTASFYGTGAATLVTRGTLNLNVGDINTDSKGGAGIFAYGTGKANVYNVNINTEKDTSGGIHVAGGGTLYAGNVNATTKGESSAAIRSDRGGGKMIVDAGTYTTNGSGSPAIYCTADIEVNDAKLIANNSEGICIEGLNTTTLRESKLTCNMPDLSQNDCTWSIIVYQSMSGDSKIGKGTFNMEGGSIESKNGGIFYTTNTESVFNLTNVDIMPNNDFEFLLKATGNKNKRGWGQENANGANCTFNANNQNLFGTIIYDSISTLNLNLSNNSTFEGIIIDDESAVSSAGSGFANVTIDETSSWHLSNDTSINKLSLKGKLLDQDGNTIKIINTNGETLREGDSEITLTVNELI